ncbi:MAG: ATP:cob(I)alamin adenosyltransferase [Actinobacteria bacterium]|jgi:cob(I)alamin adenosyltransferase|nr:MAG: ATP:cob(I)alamin adenosyltransferase [Actinomycetota bacterium]
MRGDSITAWGKDEPEPSAKGGARMTESDNPPISTRRGDDGTTTLLGAGRLSKADAPIVVLGDIDEASSFLGLARVEASTAGASGMANLLLDLQRLVYRVMGDVAMPKEQNFIVEGDVAFLDDSLEEWRGRTDLPNEFVIPGGSRLGALLDVARSVVRRAERSLVAGGYAEAHPEALRAVNRLSDLLFVLARNADGRHDLSRG